MDSFKYKKTEDLMVLSASITDYSFKKHAHEEFAVGVTLRGIQEYTLDGKHQASHQNGVMLFNPGQVHDGNSQNELGIDYVMLYIEQKLFTELLAMKTAPRFASPIVYNQALENRILHIANAVMDEKEDAYCSELIYSLGKYLNPNPAETQKQDTQLVATVKEIICSDIKKVLSLNQICDSLHMSKYQLIRSFEACTGISPYQYFLNWKIEQAKRIIEKNSDVYAAIAECNFVDLAHLNRHFKRIYGVTASEYMTYTKN